MTTNQLRSQLIVSHVVVVALAIIGLLCSLVLVDGIRPTAFSSMRSNPIHTTPFSSLNLPFSSPSLSPSQSFRTRLFDSKSAPESREEEIRKKIEKLKEEGRLGNSQASSEAYDLSNKKRSSAYDDYADKVQGKLGKQKGQMLGFKGDGTKNWGRKRAPKTKTKTMNMISMISLLRKKNLTPPISLRKRSSMYRSRTRGDVQ